MENTLIFKPGEWVILKKEGQHRPVKVLIQLSQSRFSAIGANYRIDLVSKYRLATEMEIKKEKMKNLYVADSIWMSLLDE